MDLLPKEEIERRSDLSEENRGRISREMESMESRMRRRRRKNGDFKFVIDEARLDKVPAVIMVRSRMLLPN